MSDCHSMSRTAAKLRLYPTNLVDTKLKSRSISPLLKYRIRSRFLLADALEDGRSAEIEEAIRMGLRILK